MKPIEMKSKGYSQVVRAGWPGSPGQRGGLVEMPSAVSHQQPAGSVWALEECIISHCTAGSPGKSCSRHGPPTPQQPQVSCLYAAILHSLAPRRGQNPLWVRDRSRSRPQRHEQIEATPGFKGMNSFFQARKVLLLPL